MKSFLVADLNPQGEVHATQPYDYATLERVPGCTQMMATFSNHLYRAGGEFEVELLGHDPRGISFRWHASAPTAGIATVRANGQLASLSILATGINPDADRITLSAFQQHVTKELHDTGFEPGFGLMSLHERPLLATMTLGNGPDDEAARLIVALADRCFAASYFRYHQLA